MQEAISLILLCKKPFSVEAVEHSQWHVRSVQRERMCRTSIPDFHFSPTQKVKGDLSCERPPLLSEFRRSGSEPNRNIMSSRIRPVLANRSPPFLYLPVTTPAARGLLVLSPCSRLPVRLVDFPPGSSDFPCGSSDSPLRSSLISPRLLSPSRGLLLR